MIPRILFCAALAGMVTVAAEAQTVTAQRQERAGPTAAAGLALPPALLKAVETWLAANFDLPAVHDHPRIALVPAATIAGLRYKGLLPAQSVTAQQDVMGVYIDSEKAIYLPDDWTGATPAQLSVLVHEMVHHLQNVGGIKYECPQARERPAYLAQNRWLRLFGRDLADEFHLDPFSLLVKMQCGY